MFGEIEIVRIFGKLNGPCLGEFVESNFIKLFHSIAFSYFSIILLSHFVFFWLPVFSSANNFVSFWPPDDDLNENVSKYLIRTSRGITQFVENHFVEK